MYAAARLDADSEGLLLLTNDGKPQARISDPRYKMEKCFGDSLELAANCRHNTVRSSINKEGQWP